MNTPAYLDDLNEVQRAATLHSGTSLLILAGAGSGKTRVITTKIAYLIDCIGLDAYSILAVTFTNKAAAEMRARATQLCADARRVHIRTFHSFGAWLMRRWGEHIGIRPDFVIYDEDDSRALLQLLHPDLDRSYLADVSRRIARAKDLGLLPDDDLGWLNSDKRFPELYRAYNERLRSIGNLDFGDLILCPIQLLRANKDVRASLQERFRALLVDEYQDTNVAQSELLRLLKGAHNYLCVVGDDDQSIYRFRGAEVRNILTFTQSFQPAEIIRLEQNYRSTGAILRVAAAIVNNNSGRLGKQLWTAREQGQRPIVSYLPNDQAEASFCASLLARKRGESAILYRTNAQSRQFESALLRANIPYRIIGTLRFYEREEVKDVVAFLRLYINHGDEISFRRIINKPARGIGASGLETILAGESHPDDLLALCQHAEEHVPARLANALRRFRAIIEYLEAQLPAETLGDFIERLVNRSGLQEYHARGDPVVALQKTQNLEELINAAALYPGTREGIIEFLESVELEGANSNQSAEEAQVTLITMHNTKGLEFDRVVLTGLVEGLFPRENVERDELEEERRLLYVAVTRARTQLYLTYFRRRLQYGRIVISEPSRFLPEIPADLLQFASDSLPTLPAGRHSPYSAASGQRFPIGAEIYHDQYGPGVIVNRQRNGKNQLLFVRFASGRQARFIEEYARLERIESET